MAHSAAVTLPLTSREYHFKLVELWVVIPVADNWINWLPGILISIVSLVTMPISLLNICFLLLKVSNSKYKFLSSSTLKASAIMSGILLFIASSLRVFARMDKSICFVVSL